MPSTGARLRTPASDEIRLDLSPSVLDGRVSAVVRVPGHSFKLLQRSLRKNELPFFDASSIASSTSDQAKLDSGAEEIRRFYAQDFFLHISGEAGFGKTALLGLDFLTDYREILLLLGSSGLAATLYNLLKAWVDNKNGRRFRIKIGDFELEATQMSLKQFLRLFEKVKKYAKFGAPVSAKESKGIRQQQPKMSSIVHTVIPTPPRKSQQSTTRRKPGQKSAGHKPRQTNTPAAVGNRRKRKQ
jgi:hypothetical protein